MNGRPTDSIHELDEVSRERFARDGYLVRPGLADPEQLRGLRALALEHLDPVIGPAEFEADVHYPGAPDSRAAAGGETPRRLLAALARDRLFRDWATGAAVGAVLRALLGGEVRLAQGHHNCVMTKFPGFSSATMWHQDIRYWSFDSPELVSVWLALGEEREANGALKLIPGSHCLELDRGRFDAELFLRPELEENAALIDTAVNVELEPGDVVFFDARTFHAAGRNETDAVKLSLVFTYHREDNRPIPGTRSANYPSLQLDGGPSSASGG
ncbi:MAG: phytanoyl-CoA dioxygenase family protein [Pseudomonadales bacterium]|jgi:phytanoyl-CoA hydroxylase|nr:phytanoyl-CoA dioxygenase family protein [Pseudomonadales bacterium]